MLGRSGRSKLVNLGALGNLVFFGGGEDDGINLLFRREIWSHSAPYTHVTPRYCITQIT